jgi:hypothetical protein
MNVKELIELLGKFDESKDVYLDGCDCMNAAVGVKDFYYDYLKRNVVEITIE